MPRKFTTSLLITTLLITNGIALPTQDTPPCDGSNTPSTPVYTPTFTPTSTPTRTSLVPMPSLGTNSGVGGDSVVAPRKPNYIEEDDEDEDCEEYEVRYVEDEDCEDEEEFGDVDGDHIEDEECEDEEDDEEDNNNSRVGAPASSPPTSKPPTSNTTTSDLEKPGVTPSQVDTKSDALGNAGLFNSTVQASESQSGARSIMPFTSLSVGLSLLVGGITWALF